MRLLLLAFLTIFCTGVRAQNGTEEITKFSVDIQTRQDGTHDVTETITVVANGDQIKRGITRALNVDQLGTDVDPGNLEYEVVSVTRNGAEEPFSVRKKGGMPTVYIGSKNVRLDPGSYTYVLKYKAKNQVYNLGSIDEIRWPLEGGAGTLPIKDADITIRFDRDIDIIESRCYTGEYGSVATNCEFSQDGNVVTFVVTQPLKAGEGMTVAASIAAGYFQKPPPPPPPPPFERNALLYTLIVGFVISLQYAYSSWKKYGVDPESDPVKPEFYPPADLSPASVAYLAQHWPLPQQVTASLTALATAGYVHIGEEKRSGLMTEYDVFTINPTDKIPRPENVPAEQLALYEKLLAAGPVVLGEEYNEAVEKAGTAHGESLAEQHKAFLAQGRNYRHLWPLLCLLLGTLAVAGFFLFQYGIGKIAFIVAVLAALVLFSVYTWLIAQPSPEKVALLNHIKGLKQYLKLSEKKRRGLSAAPEMTPEYYQQMLPFAIALGVENDWADDLSAYFAASGTSPQNSGMVVMPILAAGFAGRFGGSVNKTAVNPATSSGGGFAGGGGSVGGGGGTGGW